MPASTFARGDGRFDLGQLLALLDRVADLDRKVGQLARHLRADIHALQRYEAAERRNHLFDIAANRRFDQRRAAAIRRARLDDVAGADRERDDDRGRDQRMSANRPQQPAEEIPPAFAGVPVEVALLQIAMPRLNVHLLTRSSSNTRKTCVLQRCATIAGAV